MIDTYKILQNLDIDGTIRVSELASISGSFITTDAYGNFIKSDKSNLELTYATKSELSSVSGDLQSQLDSIDISGDISSYVDPISASLQTQIWSNESNIQTKLDSSVFASVSGSFLTSDDDSSFATKSQLSSVSGDLQSQLDSIDISGDISSYVDPISASLQTQIWSNESNIQTKLDSSVFASVSGSFLTSDDDSSFATKSQLSSVSGDLQSQLDSIDISGDISSYVDPISASLQTQIWSNESNIQTKLDSSVFASVSGSFLTSDDDSSFATKSQLSSVSGDLQSQLDSIDISGDISSYVDPISASLQTQIWSNESNIQTKLDSSVFASVSGSFLTSDDDSYLATKAELVSVSGDLQSQLDSIDISGDISSYVDPISASLQTQIWSNESNIQTKLDSSVFASVSGSFLTSDDDSSFATKSELNSVSGDLQSQLDSIDISGDISSYVDPISASLQTQIWSNESNIQTKLDSSVFASVSGSFLTSDDDSSFATKSELNSVSGDLQSQLDSIDISGDISSYVDPISASLQTQIWSNESNIQTKLDSSVFASVSGSFLTSDDDSYLATKAELVSVSGDLQSQLDSIDISGDISSYVDPISASLQTQIWSNESNIQTKLDSSVFASVSGSFLTSDDDSSFATKSELNSVSGDLQSQLDSIDISGDISSYVDPISASLQTQIWSNESNIQTKLDSSVFASVSGSFLTSDDDSSFATKSELNSVSGDLQSQLDSIDISGDISSYVDPISASLQTQIWSNESNIQTKLDSSVFASVSGSFLTSDDDSYLATKAELVSVSGDLQSQLDSIDISGDISSYVDPISASLQTQIWSNGSNIQTKLDSSVFASVSGSFLTSDDDSYLATKAELVSVSGDLQSQLDSIDISGDISSYVDPISASLQTQILTNDTDIFNLTTSVNEISANKLEAIDLSNLEVTISTTENISAASFYGDGSNLTNLTIPTSFESIVWNHDSYPEIVNINNEGILISKSWTNPDGMITMVNNYDIEGVIQSKTLSGNIPLGVDNVKTYVYSGDILTNKIYSENPLVPFDYLNVNGNADQNIWQYTEDVASNRYAVVSSTKQIDTSLAIVNGASVVLTRVTMGNFYSSIRSQINGLGLTPFTVGNRYFISCFVYTTDEVEGFAWQRPITNGSANGHNAKFITNKPRRIWSLLEATSSSQLDPGEDPTLDLGDTSGQDTYWLVKGSGPGLLSTSEIYMGGFQIEEVDSSYKDGIALIGDSTLQGDAGSNDLPTSIQISRWIEGLLNATCFNRAIGGERTDQMDARWSTDITPLSQRCKYVIIQGGVNDFGNSRSLVDVQNSVTSMHNKAIADGLIPIHFTCSPSTGIMDVPSDEVNRKEFNVWLTLQGWNVIDINTIVDPTNSGVLLPEYTGDGIHYNASAKREIGIYVANDPIWEFTMPTPYQKIVTV